MRSLSDTIARLKRLHGTSAPLGPISSSLRPFAGYGSNPGQLNGWIYVPEGIAPGAPLVVVVEGP